MTTVHDAYRNFMRTPSGLILSEDAARLRYAPKKETTGGDVFSGCGGAALGFKQAGIRVLFGVELWTTAALTYLMNLGAFPLKLHIETDALTREFEKQIVHTNKTTGLQTIQISGHNRPVGMQGTEAFWIWDVRNLTGQMILDDFAMTPGELDVLHGSPPCQGFSYAGKRNIADPRNNLMLEYARLINEIRPKSFTLEQVPGVLNMTTADGQPMLDAFLEAIEAGGYASRKALEKMIAAQGGSAMLMHRARGKVEPKKSKRAKAKPHVEQPASVESVSTILDRLRGRDALAPTPLTPPPPA